jgi:5'-nucleotidase
VNRKLIAAALAACALVASVLPAAGAGPAPAKAKPPEVKDTNVQLLAINDFHGHIEPNTPGTIQTGQRLGTGTEPRVVNITVPAGGAEYLATHIKALRATNPNTFTVGSGDLIGASPLTSGLFHDEPAIEALNAIGIDVSGIGNHEFDEGLAEVYRMLNGGCHPVDGCQDGDGFIGAVFEYLAANVFFVGTNTTVLPAYQIRKVDNAKIAFIGLTLEGTPLIVTPSAIEGLEFRDEIVTVNALVAKLRREQGVRAFVILLHQGGFQNAPFSNATPNADPALALPGWAGINSCDNMTGEIVDIANGLSDDVDVIVSGHTHAQYICAGANEIDGKVVTSASSFGRLVTDIDLVIDHQTKDVKSATARNVLVTQTVAKDPAVTTIVEKYRTISAPIANRVVGSITADLLSTRDGGANAAGESPLGDVIADAQLEATTPTDFGGAVISFMNPGGIRAPLLYSASVGGELPGQITYGEIFNVQPFGNTLVVKTCTGAQIQAILEQQFVVQTPPRFLQISNSLHYSWGSLQPAGDKVVNSSVTINGAPVVDGTSYRVQMNSFLADGGDGFSVFRACTNQLGGEVDVDALGRYFMAHSPISPPTLNRITKIN